MQLQADAGTERDREVEAKLRLLERADELGNVSRACAETGFSRDSYYRFRKLFASGGAEALRETSRASRPAGPASPATAQAADAKPLAPGTAQHLLNNAFCLFAQRNYAQVSIKDISDATGLNAALIYYYFGSKEGLFLKVVEMAAVTAHESFREISSQSADPEEIISTWILNHSRQFKLMRDLIKISIDYANTHDGDPRIDRAIRKFYLVERDILHDAIGRGMAEGRFRQVDIENVVTFISTFLDGVLVRSVMFEEFDYREAIQQLRDFAIGSMLGR